MQQYPIFVIRTLAFLLACFGATLAPAYGAPLPPPPELGPGAIYHRVFVTSESFIVSTNLSDPPNTTPGSGTIGGIKSADYWATVAASDSGLLPNWSGHTLDYTAIMSDGTVNAKDRINVQGPIYNMQNELIAVDAADLWDGSRSRPFSETGAA